MSEFPKHFFLRVDIEEHTWKKNPELFVALVKREVEAAGSDLFDFIVKERAKDGGE